MNQVELRPLEAADADRVLELERQLFGAGAWTPGMVAAELAGTGRWYRAAVSDGQLVGYAGLWYDGDVTQVMTLGVDPDYQGCGIGRALLQSLIDESIRLDAKGIFLEVATNNQAAISLYRSVGFLPIAVRKRYYQPENQDAYTMRLEL